MTDLITFKAPNASLKSSPKINALSAGNILSSIYQHTSRPDNYQENPAQQPTVRRNQERRLLTSKSKLQTTHNFRIMMILANVFGLHSNFGQSNLSSCVHDNGRVKGLIMQIPTNTNVTNNICKHD